MGLSLFSAALFVNATDCTWTTIASELQLNNRPVIILKDSWYKLHSITPDHKLYRSFDSSDPKLMNHQVIFHNDGALVTNAAYVRDILAVYDFEDLDGTHFYLTQNRGGTGTCNFYKVGIDPTNFKSITVYLGEQ